LRSSIVIFFNKKNFFAEGVHFPGFAAIFPGTLIEEKKANRASVRIPANPNAVVVYEGE
jgi:hypothetical protein